MTFEGKTPSGEYVDVTRFVDALSAGLQEDVFATLLNQDKVPYTDGGASLILGVVKARLQQGILDGGLAEVDVPAVQRDRCDTGIGLGRLATTASASRSTGCGESDGESGSR